MGIIAYLSSNGWKSGYHEWSFKILRCDVYRQEIGVIGTDNIENMEIGKNGIQNTRCFGSRAFYFNELLSGSLYYGSYNENGKKRCFKDLSNYKKNKTGWCTGDIIKISLDLDKSKIRYFVNDKKILKSMSLESKQMYYPIILFSGHCQYELLNFK